MITSRISNLFKVTLRSNWVIVPINILVSHSHVRSLLVEVCRYPNVNGLGKFKFVFVFYVRISIYFKLKLTDMAIGRP